MNQSTDIQSTLKKYFGFDQFRKGQKETIENIMEGNSAAAIFPTGSGKSLCYQLPALLLPELTLVISPLLALMEDQVNFLQSKGISAVRIDSSLSREEETEIQKGIKEKKHKILMISVERLKNERFRNFIQNIPISLLVIDEAHCISEWGHNFRPDYLKIPIYQKQLQIPQVLLLTATATPQVVKDMQNKFDIQEKNVVCTGFYRENLHLELINAPEENKQNLLIEQIKQQTTTSGIVYVSLQKTAEDLAQILQSQGIKAKAYHAGIDSQKRSEIQDEFMSGKVSCIVATIAFGMGIDKSDIRYVIHYDLPKSIENYSQEIGRAGRDGNNSNCVVLANANGIPILENFVYGDTPEPKTLEKIINRIPKDLKYWEFKLNKLSKENNIRLLPLKTLLVYLEMKNIIQASYSYFASYRFYLNKDEDWIINQFQGERKTFIQNIFRASQKARKWYTMDFDILTKEWKMDRKRVINALEYFQEMNWLGLEAKENVEVFEVINNSFSATALIEEINQLFQIKEKAEVERIDKMKHFFESKSCLSIELAKYFGDQLQIDKCNHCSTCHGTPITIPEIDYSNYQDNKLIADTIEELKSKIKDCNKSLTAKFLCGIQLPVFTSIKARSNPKFGSLSKVPFRQVMNWIEQVGF